MALKREKKNIVWQDIRPVKKQPVKLTKTPRKNQHRFLNKIKRAIVSHKKRYIFIFSALALILALIILYILLRPTSTINTNTTNTQTTVKDPTSLIQGTPSYDTVLPRDKSLKDLGGGWVRQDKNPLLVYIDKIGTTQINVSEQPIPDTFKPDIAQNVKELAQGFGATTKISVGGISVYIGTYDKGLQRVIFTKNNLLILISANTNITTEGWTNYINSLQ